MSNEKNITSKDELLKRLGVDLNDPNLRTVISLVLAVRNICRKSLDKQGLDLLMAELMETVRKFVKILNKPEVTDALSGQIKIKPSHVRILQYANQTNRFNIGDFLKQCTSRKRQINDRFVELRNMGLLRCEEGSKRSSRGRRPQVYKLTVLGKRILEYLDTTFNAEYLKSMKHGVLVPKWLLNIEERDD